MKGYVFEPSQPTGYVPHFLSSDVMNEHILIDDGCDDDDLENHNIEEDFNDDESCSGISSDFSLLSSTSWSSLSSTTHIEEFDENMLISSPLTLFERKTNKKQSFKSPETSYQYSQLKKSCQVMTEKPAPETSYQSFSLVHARDEMLEQRQSVISPQEYSLLQTSNIRFRGKIPSHTRRDIGPFCVTNEDIYKASNIRDNTVFDGYHWVRIPQFCSKMLSIMVDCSHTMENDGSELDTKPIREILCAENKGIGNDLAPYVNTISRIISMVCDAGKIDERCILVALYYMDKAVCNGMELGKKNIIPVLACSIMLASKFYEDRYMSNDLWAKYLNITDFDSMIHNQNCKYEGYSWKHKIHQSKEHDDVITLNYTERQILKSIDYRLTVKYGELMLFVKNCSIIIDSRNTSQIESLC